MFKNKREIDFKLIGEDDREYVYEEVVPADEEVERLNQLQAHQPGKRHHHGADASTLTIQKTVHKFLRSN
jgi:hypothetical protein